MFRFLWKLLAAHVIESPVICSLYICRFVGGLTLFSSRWSINVHILLVSLKSVIYFYLFFLKHMVSVVAGSRYPHNHRGLSLPS